MCLALLLTVLPHIASADLAMNMEIIAHRGSSYEAPENTLASVELAWTEKSDAVEIDVHLTRDNRVVVMHDSNTKRTSGKNMEIRESTLAELRELDVGLWKGEKWAGERVPLLEEVLATIPDGKRLLVEVKCGPEIVPALTKSVHESGKKPRQVAIIGFGLKTMQAVKQALPEHNVYWLVMVKKDESGQATPPLDGLIKAAKTAGLDGLNLSHCDAFDASYVDEVNKSGLKMLVWTVNDPKIASKMERIGVDGLTTDRPGWIRSRLIAEQGH